MNKAELIEKYVGERTRLETVLEKLNDTESQVFINGKIGFINGLITDLKEMEEDCEHKGLNMRGYCYACGERVINPDDVIDVEPDMLKENSSKPE